MRKKYWRTRRRMRRTLGRSLLRCQRGIACSTATAIQWNADFTRMAELSNGDCSGRAVTSVHNAAAEAVGDNAKAKAETSAKRREEDLFSSCLLVLPLFILLHNHWQIIIYAFFAPKHANYIISLIHLIFSLSLAYIFTLLKRCY